MTLEKALQEYVAYKSDTPKAAREIGQRVERLRRNMQSVFGKQKLKHLALSDITRQDANELRDHLLSRVSANSAVRMLGVVRTAINCPSSYIMGHYSGLSIEGSGSFV